MPISSGTAAIGLPTFLALERDRALGVLLEARRRGPTGRSPARRAGWSPSRGRPPAAAAHRPVHVRGRRRRHLGDHLARGGVEHLVDAPVGALPPLAADVVAPGAGGHRRSPRLDDCLGLSLLPPAGPCKRPECGQQRLTASLCWRARPCRGGRWRHGRAIGRGAAGGRRPDERVRRAVADGRLQLLQLGSQVLPRGLPGYAGHPQRVSHPDRLPRQRRRDGEGSSRDRGRRPTTSSTARSAGRASCAARTPSSPGTSTVSAPARSTSSRRCGPSPSTPASTSPAGSLGRGPARQNITSRVPWERHAGRPGARRRLGAGARPAGGRRDRSSSATARPPFTARRCPARSPAS